MDVGLRGWSFCGLGVVDSGVGIEAVGFEVGLGLKTWGSSGAAASLGWVEYQAVKGSGLGLEYGWAQKLRYIAVSPHWPQCHAPLHLQHFRHPAAEQSTMYMTRNKQCD